MFISVFYETYTVSWNYMYIFTQIRNLLCFMEESFSSQIVCMLIKTKQKKTLQSTV